MISKIFIRIIRFYQNAISPLLPASCKYLPSCSEYMIEAIKEWGLLAGFTLGVFRILRCNPFSKGGYDPVPENKFKKRNRNE